MISTTCIPKPWALDEPWQHHSTLTSTIWTPRPYELKTTISPNGRPTTPGLPEGFLDRFPSSRAEDWPVNINRARNPALPPDLNIPRSSIPSPTSFGLSPFAQPFQPKGILISPSTSACPSEMDITEVFLQSEALLPPSPALSFVSDEYFTPYGTPETVFATPGPWFEVPSCAQAVPSYASMVTQSRDLASSVTSSRSASSASSEILHEWSGNEELSRKSSPRLREPAKASYVAVTTGHSSTEDSRAEEAVEEVETPVGGENRGRDRTPKDIQDRPGLEQSTVAVGEPGLPARNRQLAQPRVMLGNMAKEAWRKRQMKRVTITGIVG
ncbi:hypothetical protein C8J56DRAFT_912444 [Mycena floridula]|nr:hypothetical protein C8J56DRAFT_912444 [Mycena floridula]